MSVKEALKHWFKPKPRMKVYHISIHPDAKGGGFSWSETKEKRKPDKNAVRWYAADSDGFPLGPLPEQLKTEIARHWALSDASNADLPDFFMSLTARHFSGLQAVNEKLANLYRAYSGAELELFRIPKFWSLTDKAEVSEAYYFANVYAVEHTLDLTRSSHIEVTNPKLAGAQRFWITSMRNKRVSLVRGFYTNKNVWRDSNTSDWFCNEEFRKALEATSPGNFLFIEISQE